MQKKLIIAVVFVVTVFGGAIMHFNSNINNNINNSTTAPLPSSKVFTIVCEQWPPFEYLENGNPKGINVEAVDIIMKKLNIPYQIKFYPWARAWMYAQKGLADAVLSVSYKKEREEYLLYTDEQKEFCRTQKIPQDRLWISEYRFFVKKKNRHKLNFTSYKQIKVSGYRIGIDKSYSYHPKFWEYDLKTKTYSSNKSGFKALITDEIDLYPLDTLVGNTRLKELGLLDSVTTLPKPLFKKPYHFLLTKNSNYPNKVNIRDQFYEELRKMHKSGKYQLLYDAYVKGH